MTDQITVPRETWDAMREAFKPFEKLFKQMTDVHPTPTNFDCQIAVRDLRALIYSFDALTAANAVSEQQGEAKTYAPSRQRVVMACDILDRIKEAHENWGGWSGTPSSCDAAINLLRYPANMPVNAAHPQATEPQAVASTITLAQLVQAHCERNLSHEVDAKMAEQIADLLVSDPATEQFLRRLLAGSGTTDTAAPEQKP